MIKVFSWAAALVTLAVFGSAVAAPRAEPAQARGDSTIGGALTVLQLRPNFFMIAGAGGNIGVQIGDDGVVVVDSGSASNADAVVAAIKKISPQPIRYVINTGPDADHVGGNASVSRAGQTLFTGGGGPGIAPSFIGGAASILSHEKVLARVSAASAAGAALPGAGWPTETFHQPRKYMYLNGEGIEVLHQPAAHSDGDALVFFRRSDIVVAGDVLDTTRFPVIDVERGGTIDGEIAALNRLVDLAIPSVPIVSREEGTLVIPGHGRVCDQLDVVEYRDMVTIVRDRVRDLIRGGASLQQVKAAAPARGYTPALRLGHRLRGSGVSQPLQGKVMNAGRSAHAVFALFVLGAASVLAQGRGGGPPPAPRASAAIDLTGYWVAVVTEDWQYRMMTPKKGDYGFVPMTPEARKIADAWDPAADQAAGNQCKAFGAAAIMRVPGRVHITWQDDSTLKVEADAGMQTRLFSFGPRPATLPAPSWQGVSIAQWERPPGPPNAPPPGGGLKVVTTNLRSGYLRWNGVPYSDNAVVTEYFDVGALPSGGQVMMVTTVVEDPRYLVVPFIVSSQFKKETDGAKWDPTPCTSTW